MRLNIDALEQLLKLLDGFRPSQERSHREHRKKFGEEADAAFEAAELKLNSVLQKLKNATMTDVEAGALITDERMTLAEMEALLDGVEYELWFYEKPAAHNSKVDRQAMYPEEIALLSSVKAPLIEMLQRLRRQLCVELRLPTEKN